MARVPTLEVAVVHPAWFGRLRLWLLIHGQVLSEDAKQELLDIVQTAVGVRER